MKKFRLILMIYAVIVCCGGVSYGALTAVGPTSAQTNFPLFYTDSNTLSLELCLTPPDAGPPCFFDPVIQGNLLSGMTGFGGEGFWFLADSQLDSGGVTGTLVLAVEAAYGAGDPEPGTQISFARVRIRVDVPDGTSGGTYTVTHPYGVRTYAGIPACNDPGRTCSVINETLDVGVGAPGVFTGALAGEIGPFLTMDPLDTNYAVITALWPGYIGDSATPVKVVGSPFTTNYFRVEGPGGIDVQQDLFTLIGKIYTGNVPTALKIDRVAYTRSAAPGNPGHVDIFATSAPLATVNGSGSGLPLTALTGDGAGNFYAHIFLASATTLPAVVTVTANNSANDPTNLITTLFSTLSDFVTISRAEYSTSCGKLAIDASSSDQLAPLPQLSAAGFGNLSPVAPAPLQRRVVTTAGTPPVAVMPPSEISVTSAKGGSEKKLVSIVENIAPVANYDAAITDIQTVKVINVLANDVDLDGSINTASVSIVTPAAHGTAVANVDGTVTYTPDGIFVGTDSFTYTVQDTPCAPSVLVATSNAATVTVAVNAYSLLLTKTGPGTVTSTPAGIDCGDRCSANFAPGQLVTLTAVPDALSALLGWSVDCTGSALECSLTMNTAKNVTATFDACSNSTVRVSPNFYTAISDAYTNVQTPAVYDLRGGALVTYTVPLFDQARTVTLRGGYDCGYAVRSGTSSVTGPVTVSGGAVTADSITIE
ncbi:MAG: cadherin-like domain-containing protein [Nitrospirae bacterium]|nr:cadherin-like domain-containing protein [Nitrospirota bacterium]